MLLQTVGFSFAQEKLSDEQINFFETKIRPVLVSKCYGCHSNKVGQLRGGLALDTQDATLAGGDSGPAIVPHELDESLLWEAINYDGYAMPPEEQLPADVIEDFRKWIEMGAPDPRVTVAAQINSKITQADIEAGRKFWAYQSPEVIPASAVDDQEWPRNQIDNYVLQSLESSDLNPAEDALPHVILRRLCFDITGLPPSIEQIDWFEKRWEQNPDEAIAYVADRLLESEQFGERWGRHWLDVARYAESSGKEMNTTFPHAWRYRDYVIDAFNKDKPYDQFVKEQIAGDLLPVDSDEEWTENLLATGFLTLGPKTLTEQNPIQFYLDQIDEQIDVTTRVFLGTSVACARCHDHKFDPIPQADYYAMAGIFQSTDTLFGTLDTFQNRRPSTLVHMPVADPNPFDESYTRAELEKLKQELEDVNRRLQEARQARRQNRKSSDAPVSVASVARLSARAGALKLKLESVDEDGNPVSFCMAVQPREPRDARLLVRGEFDQPAQQVPRGFVQVLDENSISIDSDSTGRLELAEWIGSAENPLTARVMVNRIWMHLIGRGLVTTSENFGASGEAPSHPELLDYLAVEFVDNGWSVKQIIKQVVTSRTYRMSGEFNERAFARDPENRLVWRANPQRLDAEQFRDAMLSISGEIDLRRPRGSLIAKVGDGVVRDGVIFSEFNSNSDQNTNTRNRRNRKGNSMTNRQGSTPQYSVTEIDRAEKFRSVYLPIIRDNLPRSLEVFDFAEPSMVVGQREASNTSVQGLYLLNNDFVIQQADAMSTRLMKSSSDLQQQVQLAFNLAYGRKASVDEMKIAEEFFGQYMTGDNDFARQRALSAFCQALFGSAEFRFLN